MANSAKYDHKVRELAYTVWRDCCQSVDDTARAMADRYGYVIKRQTLTTWKNRYGWTARAARTEAEEKLLARDTTYTKMLLDLCKRKVRYDEYLDALPIDKIDNQVLFAYNNIINAMIRVKKQRDEEQAAGGMDRPRLFLEHMEFICLVLKDSDPEALKSLARNYDRIVSRFKEVETSAVAEAV